MKTNQTKGLLCWFPLRRIFLAWLPGVFLAISTNLLPRQTPDQQLAAFNGSAAITNQSYNWVGMNTDTPPVPIQATTTQTPLPFSSNLTVLSFDPAVWDSQPTLYQQKSIGGTSYECTLVATFAGAYSTWTGPNGTESVLTYAGGTKYTFPYVTSGSHLKDYLTANYFSSQTDAPDAAAVSLRITQSLGLDPTAVTGYGLAFFWVPLTNLARPAYSANITAQLPEADIILAKNANGSYNAIEASSPAGFNYRDYNDASKLYTGASALTTFAQYNEAQTKYPWTAMGYTYNWNALQDGSNPSYGNDPSHVSDFTGPSEFVVSAGSTVVLDNYVYAADLGTWLIPEPGTVILLLFGAGVVFFVRYRCLRGHKSHSPARVAHQRLAGSPSMRVCTTMCVFSAWPGAGLPPITTRGFFGPTAHRETGRRGRASSGRDPGFLRRRSGFPRG